MYPLAVHTALRCYPPHRSASQFQIGEFNLRADSAHAMAADLATHHGRITSHNYTAIMSQIKSAKKKKKEKKEKKRRKKFKWVAGGWDGGMEGVGALVSLRGLVTVLWNKRRRTDRKTFLIKAQRKDGVSSNYKKCKRFLTGLRVILFQFCTFFKKFSVANFRSGGRTKKKKQSSDVSQKKSPP